jgi:hypothetical protein
MSGDPKISVPHGEAGPGVVAGPGVAHDVISFHLDCDVAAGTEVTSMPDSDTHEYASFSAVTADAICLHVRFPLSGANPSLSSPRHRC